MQRPAQPRVVPDAHTAAAHFDYDDLSRRTNLVFGNGTQVDYGYELNNDVSSVEIAFSGSTLDFAYGFNGAHQLISQSVSDAQHLWHPNTPGTVEYAANKLNQYVYASGNCGRLYKGYNANGCLIDDGVWRFDYDTENHLVTADDGTVSATYVYDPLHRQIQKNVDGTKTRFIYAGWQRLGDYDGASDTLQNRYVYGVGLDEPLIKVASGGTLTFMYADRLGSIAAIADNTGAVSNRYSYSPHGESGSMSGTTFGFTAQRYDAETGLYYFKNRYYSPRLGRFLQPDPIPSINLYTYASNDSLNGTDSLGLSPLSVLQNPQTATTAGRVAQGARLGGPTVLGVVIVAGTSVFITWQQYQRLLKAWENLHQLEEEFVQMKYDECKKGANKFYDDEKAKLDKKYPKNKWHKGICYREKQKEYLEELEKLNDKFDAKIDYCNLTKANFPYTPPPSWNNFWQVVDPEQEQMEQWDQEDQ